MSLFQTLDSTSKEYSALIFFMIDWFDLLAEYCLLTVVSPALKTALGSW